MDQRIHLADINKPTVTNVDNKMTWEIYDKIMNQYNGDLTYSRSWMS